MFKKLKSWWKRRRRGNRIAADIFYIAGDGNDDYDGKHPLRPWRTIDKLNASKMKIRAGDQILFRRGFSSSGRPFYLDQTHKDLRIGAYGSGFHPVFPDAD